MDKRILNAAKRSTAIVSRIACLTLYLLSFQRHGNPFPEVPNFMKFHRRDKMNRRIAACISIAVVIGTLGVLASAQESQVFRVQIVDGHWGLLAWFEEISIYPVDPVEQTLGPLAATFRYAKGPIEVFLTPGEYELMVRIPYLEESASYGRFVVEEHDENIVDLRTYEFPEALLTD